MTHSPTTRDGASAEKAAPDGGDIRSAFLRRVEFDANTGCWLWSGATIPGGYGCLRVDGRTQKAHRISWAIHRGESLSPAVKVCHRCDTPSCVNPDHLFLGTQADNVADMVAKGRARGGRQVGSANPMASLNEGVVAEILSVLGLRRFSQAEVAASYGVSPMTISRIARGHLWRHVTSAWPIKEATK